jgi:uncharacterized membrane protein
LALASSNGKAKPAGDYLAAVATIGALAAGVALFEVALPALAIGGAAILAPKYIPKLLPKSFGRFSGPPRPRSKPLLQALAPTRASPVALLIPNKPRAGTLIASPNLALKQAVAKTITFRLIVTSLDFTVNYLVIGELAAAAGLSAFALVVGPFFYFIHEAAWNYLGRHVEHKIDRWGTQVEIPLAGGRTLTLNRALAKTITYQIFATTMDFTANYVVVGDLATAAALSAFGFVVGPFVYWGHEAVWDRFTLANADGLIIGDLPGQVKSLQLARM